jgi:hypothetical protein
MEISQEKKYTQSDTNSTIKIYNNKNIIYDFDSLDDKNNIPSMNYLPINTGKIKKHKIYTFPVIDFFSIKNFIRVKSNITSEWLSGIKYSYLSHPPKNINDTFFFLFKNEKQIFLPQTLDNKFYEITKINRKEIENFVEELNDMQFLHGNKYFIPNPQLESKDNNFIKFREKYKKENFKMKINCWNYIFVLIVFIMFLIDLIFKFLNLLLGIIIIINFLLLIPIYILYYKEVKNRKNHEKAETTPNVSNNSNYNTPYEHNEHRIENVSLINDSNLLDKYSTRYNWKLFLLEQLVFSPFLNLIFLIRYISYYYFFDLLIIIGPYLFLLPFGLISYFKMKIEVDDYAVIRLNQANYRETLINFYPDHTTEQKYREVKPPSTKIQVEIWNYIFLASVILIVITQIIYGLMTEQPLGCLLPFLNFIALIIFFALYYKNSKKHREENLHKIYNLNYIENPFNKFETFNDKLKTSNWKYAMIGNLVIGPISFILQIFVFNYRFRSELALIFLIPIGVLLIFSLLSFYKMKITDITEYYISRFNLTLNNEYSEVLKKWNEEFLKRGVFVSSPRNMKYLQLNVNLECLLNLEDHEFPSGLIEDKKKEDKMFLDIMKSVAQTGFSMEKNAFSNYNHV